MLKRFIQATLFCLSILSASSAFADNDLYTIGDIEVSQTAESASLAKKQAIEKGQAEAFRILVGILSTSEEESDLSAIKNEEIAVMVKSYDLADEKIAGGRYSALLNVSFNPDMVRAFLQNHNIAFSEADNISPPTLLIPVYYNNGEMVLWGDNPWLMAWDESGLQSSVLPFSIPIGDLDDQNILGNQDIVTSNDTAIIALSEKYGAEKAIIAQAKKVKSSLDIEISLRYVNNSDTTFPPQTLIIVGDRDKPEAELFNKAASNVLSRLEKDWKSRTTSPNTPSMSPRIVIHVPLQDINSWVQIKKKLQLVSAIKNLKTDEFTSANATISFNYDGKIDDLPVLFSQQGLSLSKDNDNWVLGLTPVN